MNHTTLPIVAVIAIAALLVGAVAISTSPTTTAYAWKNKKKSNDDDDNNNNNKNVDIEKSETNFIFKQKLKNNCSGFEVCINIGPEEAIVGSHVTDSLITKGTSLIALPH